MRDPQISRRENYFKIPNPLENKHYRAILRAQGSDKSNSCLTAFFPVIHWGSVVIFGKIKRA